MAIRQSALEDLVMNPDFWKGKRVLITGHTGFKGSWLCLWMQKLGTHVVGYSLDPPTDPNLFQKAGLAEGMASLTGDVRDLGQLNSVFKEHQPEIVLHLAAQSLVLSSYNHPVETYSTNIMGTVNVLETVRNHPSVRVAVIVTSDKCYENREWIWGYRENEPMGGSDPYSSSKGCAELVTSAYRNSFFNDGDRPSKKTGIASARAGNVIGGGDWARDRLIPDIMNAFLKNRPAIIRNPHSIRPWQHVLDPIHGYLILAEHLWENPRDFSEPWNFGPHWEDAQTVSWVVDRLSGLWGDGGCWEVDSREHPHEARSLNLDCSKANTRLGWAPKLKLETTLEWIVEWYKVFAGRGDVRKITQDQIARFQNLE